MQKYVGPRISISKRTVNTYNKAKTTVYMHPFWYALCMVSYADNSLLFTQLKTRKIIRIMARHSQLNIYKFLQKWSARLGVTPSPNKCFHAEFEHWGHWGLRHKSRDQSVFSTFLNKTRVLHTLNFYKLKDRKNTTKNSWEKLKNDLVIIIQIGQIKNYKHCQCYTNRIPIGPVRASFRSTVKSVLSRPAASYRPRPTPAGRGGTDGSAYLPEWMNNQFRIPTSSRDRQDNA